MDNSGKLAVEKILKKTGYADQGRDFIAHFGVKGMRWGVRRSRKELARESGKKETDESSSTPTRTVGPKSKRNSKVKLNEMSDAELRQRLNRMQMEKQYAELTSPKANPFVSAGKKVASNVVKGVAEQTLKNVGQSYATKYTADYMAKAAKTTT